MSNLVGTGLNQVPTNGMLGGLAYQDPNHASIKNLDLKNLSQINSEIADTATDVFVYDTRKDSDGGAWRKRTQNTSWYNETLGTATRGSRKEFPAVAVIVAETTKLTIYDGDDPDLPMWMAFNLLGAVGGNSNMLPRGGSGTESDITSIACLNGRLAVGLKDVSGTTGEGFVVIDFISELARIHRTTGSGYTGAIYSLLISGRNSNGEYGGDYNSLAIIVQTINDVAMTVLPNAPVDSATGLPIPTIAVATDGGLSIIKDDGTVVNKTRGTNETHSIAFDVDNSLIFSWGTSDDFPRHISRFVIADWQSTSNISFTDNYFSSYNEGAGSAAASTGSAGLGFATIANSGRHIGIEYGSGGNTDDRLVIFHPKNRTNAANQNLSAFVTSSYNTGYMHGDIKGAFLSDTDTTDAIEYVQNGYFNNNVNHWTIGSTGTTATLDSNRMLITAPTSGGSFGYVYQAITTEVGKKYKISLYYDRGTVDGRVTVRNDTTNTGANSLFYTELGASADGKTYYNTFTATATTTYILLYAMNASGGTSAYDQVSVTLEKDRSINSKGLAVYGTITKSPVATGAELVGYSGFSASNYLQSASGSISIGTNDFCVSFWYKRSSGDEINVFFDFVDGTANGFRVVPGNSANDIYLVNGNFSSFTAFAGTARPNKWTHTTVVRNYGTDIRVYQDGDLVGTTGTFASTNYNAGGVIKVGGSGATAASTCISLLRISASAPSAEQVKKMYEDEKHLFQENAKATLYGSSNAVTALVYDDTTELLHVGTSAGRSEFQGLRRINNTTTAVTTAISASNDLVAEQ